MKIWRDKDKKWITGKEFLKRFKDGINNITPIQRTRNEIHSTFTMTVGYIVGLVSLIIFRKSFAVQWFTYALIIIFLGASWGQLTKLLALRSQLKLFKNFNNESLDLNKIFDSLEYEKINPQKEETKEMKGGKNKWK